jgi:hypothetical protein
MAPEDPWELFSPFIRSQIAVYLFPFAKEHWTLKVLFCPAE